MSRQVIITGATGFLGSRLLRSLEKEDVRIRCLVRRTSVVDNWLRQLPDALRAKVEIARGELTDLAFLREQFSAGSTVYHLAAALAGGTSTMFLNTVVPTRAIIQAGANANIGRLVLISSMGVYGTQSLRTGQVLDESTPIDPHPELRDPYTFSKIRQEHVARALADSLDVPLVVVRPGVIYGPGRSLLTSRVGLGFSSIMLRMGGSQQLPYTYVDNCADAIKWAGLVEGVAGETFNVVDDRLPTGKMLIKAVRKNGGTVRTIWIPRLMIGPLSSVYHWYSRWSQGQLPDVISRYKSLSIWKSLRYSNTNAKHKLNWMPVISTEEGIRRTLSGCEQHV